MIIRVIKNSENPYVMMNKHCLQDKNLSWKAKGILAYLLSLPDDWQIYEDELQKHSKDGKDSLNKGLQELINAGYIKRDRKRNDKGQLKNYEYLVYEVPTYTGFSKVGLSKVGESATTNNYSTDNKSTNKERNKGISSEISMSFLEFAEKNPESIILDDIIPAVAYYMAIYKEYTNKDHPNLKESQWERVVAEILHVEAEYIDTYIELDDLERMVGKHFVTKYDNCDWNILHFISGDIMKNRFYEECY